MKITIHGLDKVREAAKSLREMPKQARFASIVATSRVASTVKKEVVNELYVKVDRPTNIVLNAVMVKPATKANPVAVVWLKNDMLNKRTFGMADLIGHQFTGGKRMTKRLETRLRNANILPPGAYVAPGRGAKLDAHGNMRRGEITQILTQLGALRNETGNTMSDRTFARIKSRGKLVSRGFGDKRRLLRQQYFVGRGKQSKRPIGVWKVEGKGEVVPVMAFIREPTYKKLIDIAKIADRVVARDLGREFDRALREALRSAR